MKGMYGRDQPGAPSKLSLQRIKEYAQRKEKTIGRCAEETAYRYYPAIKDLNFHVSHASTSA